MESLLAEHAKFCKRGSLSKSLDDVQKTIDLLTQARDSIASSESPLQYLVLKLCSADVRLIQFFKGQANPSLTLASLQNTIKSSCDAVTSDLKEVYKALGNYGKALEKV